MSGSYICINCIMDIPKEFIPEGYDPKNIISETYIVCPWCNGADEQCPNEEDKQEEDPDE